jgi:hypothetical protein
VGLIEAILAIFFTIFGAALSMQVVDEFKAWSPWLIDVLVGQAIRRLPEDQRERYAEQWRGDIEETPVKLGSSFSLSCYRRLPGKCRVSYRMRIPRPSPLR